MKPSERIAALAHGLNLEPCPARCRAIVEYLDEQYAAGVLLPTPARTREPQGAIGFHGQGSDRTAVLSPDAPSIAQLREDLDDLAMAEVFCGQTGLVVKTESLAKLAPDELKRLRFAIAELEGWRARG